MVRRPMVRMGVVEGYLLRRRAIARTVKPRMMPAMIDSHGKPGIGGSTIGVETAIELDDVAMVGVLMTVFVTTEREVLTTVVLNELVAVTGTDDVAMLEVLTIELLITVEDALVGVDDVVPGPPPPGGGSRWIIIPSVPSKGGIVLASPTVPPTAKPSVAERRNMAFSLPIFLNGGISATGSQNVPS